MNQYMKTITIEDDIYGKLADAKRALNAKSFTQVLRKILSEDRISWVRNLAGKIDVDEKAIVKLEGKWKEWHIQ